MPDPTAIPVTLTVGQIIGAVGLAVSSVGGIVWALVKHIGKGFVEQVEEMEGRVLQLEGSMRIAVRIADVEKLEAKLDRHHIELRGELNALGEELDALRDDIKAHNVVHEGIKHSLETGRERFERDDKRVERLDRLLTRTVNDVTKLEAVVYERKKRKPGEDDDE
jgi:DNA repair exonuclease SbcCD ATPase subunit